MFNAVELHIRRRNATSVKSGKSWCRLNGTWGYVQFGVPGNRFSMRLLCGCERDALNDIYMGHRKAFPVSA